MRVLLAGGGTAGHINPAVAIAKYIKKRNSDVQIAFVGTEDGLENKLIPREGFPVYHIDVRGFKRKLSFYNIGAARRAISSIFEAGVIIDGFKPDIVIGTGGYVSWPVLFSATIKNIPSVIHEQNALPGLTSRMLSKNVDKVMISFDQSRQYFKTQDKLVLTGNPIREELIFENKQEARNKLGLDERPFIISFAGSLGAREVNLAVIDFILKIKDESKIQYLHATGERGFIWVNQKLNDAGFKADSNKNIRIEKYIYNMPTVMAAADLVICRAGAITLSEIAALGKASLLIPSPNVANNHQEYNAMVFEKSGAAKIIHERDLSGTRIKDEIEQLLSSPESIKKMEENAYSLAIYDSCDKIYEVILSLIKKE